MASELASAYVALYPKLKTAAIAAQLGSVDMSGAGDSVGKSFGSRFGGAAAAASKVGLAALATAAAAAVAGLVNVTGAALESYASYEQLVGGVDTLFKESSGKLQAYAAGAYKTAGMSANEYMGQATSFSASLLQSLGGDTEAAVEYANMAITDMSDNANKMGTDMGRITDAYQGFAKQNFTMLDNLKLGYGGTKEEMQRLLDDAEKLSGIEYDISSYADIVDAIHVVQQELGITGTTAQEAAGTMEGSVAAAKAAYSNWLTGLADENANLGELTTQLVESVATAANNIVPRIAQILGTLETTLAENLPLILEQVRSGLETYGPTILAAAGELFKQICSALVVVAPWIISGLLDLLNQLVQYITDNMPAILDGALTMFGGVLSALGEKAPEILASLLLMLASLVVAIGNKVGEFFDGGMKMLQGLWDGAQNIFVGPVSNWFGNLGSNILSAIGDLGSLLWNAGSSIIHGLWDGLQSAWNSVSGWFGEITSQIPSLKGPAEKDAKLLVDSGKLIMRGLNAGLESGWSSTKGMLGDITDQIADSISGSWAVDAKPVAKTTTAMVFNAASAAAKVADAMAAPLSSMAISAPKLSSANYAASNGMAITAKESALTKDDVFDAMDKALSRFEGRPISITVKADNREIARVVRKYA